MTKNIDFKKFYEKEVAKLEKKFSKIFEKKYPGSLYEPCNYVMHGGGKRLRPFLVLISNYAVANGNINSYNAAIAVELLHNFTLVHDDIMDNSNKRRGNPTLHVKYDLSTAILAGDSLLAIAYDFLLKDCNGNAKKILSSFNQGLVEVCEGQSLDKDFEVLKKVTLDQYLEMINKKTAELAKMCCSLGALIGQGAQQEISALASYGKNLGLAFQLQDDLLDVIADEQEFGKPVGSDLIEGKKTYLFLKALELAKGEDKKALLKISENKGIRKNQVNRYRNIYYDLGIIDITKKEVDKYTKSALRSLNKLDNLFAQDTLKWLANSLLNRSK
ncbi:MAG: polyprenyl synthetase family protein [Ignavibacteria bacterium]